MINVFGYQAIVVSRSLEVAARFNQKFYLSVKNMIRNLREYDEVGYLKCKIWLFINHGNTELTRKGFERVDNYMKEYIHVQLTKSIQSTIVQLFRPINC